MAKYLRKGSEWKVSSDADADYRDALPPGNYIVKVNPFGFYLEESAPFSVGRIYGDLGRTADRILRTYIDRDRNTGVLAVGDKGTGKTLLARLVSSRAAAEHAIPTILVNQGFGDDGFRTLIAGIDQRAIILFDEFEKVYEDQEPLLTLLDGIYQSNKLFLLTANDEYSIDKNLVSRPGRVFYYLKYGPLDRAFVLEYCGEHLADRSMVGMVADVAEVYGNFSFDTLKALVEEMNRYGESPHAALKFLNVRMDRWSQNRRYRVSVSLDGVPVDDSRLDDSWFYMDPKDDRNTLRIDVEGEGDDEIERVILRLAPDRIVGTRDGGRTVQYRDKGYDIEATEEAEMTFDPLASLASGYDPAPAGKNGRHVASIKGED